MSCMASPWKHPDSGIYYHRVGVPKDIREQIGKSVIKFFLNTRDFSEAKRIFAMHYAETQALFEQARDRISLTPKDIEILSQRWFENALSHIEDSGSADHYIMQHSSGEASTIDVLIADALERGYQRQVQLVGNFVKDVLADNSLLILEGSDDHKKLTEKISWRYLELSKIALDRFYPNFTLIQEKGSDD